MKKGTQKEKIKIKKSRKHVAVDVHLGSAEVQVHKTGETLWLHVFGREIKNIRLSCYPEKEHKLTIYRIK